MGEYPPADDLAARIRWHAEKAARAARQLEETEGHPTANGLGQLVPHLELARARAAAHAAAAQALQAARWLRDGVEW